MPARAAANLMLIASMAVAQVHRTPMAGRWFPAEPDALSKLLEESRTTAARRSGVGTPRKGLTALIVPHAGLQYSGTVAASAYRLIDRPRTAIVLAFSHRAPVQGVVTVKVDSFETPAGTETAVCCARTRPSQRRPSAIIRSRISSHFCAACRSCRCTWAT
jgi:hypothetical protein